MEFMKKLLPLISLLLVTSAWSIEEEGLSKQDIRFLKTIDRSDKKNEALGNSIPYETKVKLIKSWTENDEPVGVSSGLTIVDTSSKGTEVTFIYRANVDISNYSQEEIRDLQELLLDRIKHNVCSTPVMRSFVFMFDLFFMYEFVDIRNIPFGGKMEFDKAECKSIKTIGRPMIFPEALLKALEEDS